MRENTFSLTETLVSARHGMPGLSFVNSTDILSPTHWKPGLTMMFYGMCHTLHYHKLFSASFEQSNFWLYLDPALGYRISFHDPQFSLITMNLVAIPEVRIVKTKEGPKEKDFDFHVLTVTEHRKINRAEAPCEEDPQYNFFTCVKRFVMEDVGCRVSWDETPDLSLPPCTTLQQTRAETEAQFNMTKDSSFEQIFE